MAVEEVTGQPWTRKHDDPRAPLFSTTSWIEYPKSLPELIELCRNRLAAVRFRAAGSHWALSGAAISDDTFIETHDPTANSTHPTMGATLSNVVPRCLNPDYLERMAGNENKPYLVHVEAGKRIYQLYAEMDQPVPDVDANGDETLAGVLKRRYNKPDFGGPHGFNTLGGAGGQTVVGALSTGTHGGDFDRAPLPDSVVALHLVADGGNHYWIEPDETPPLTDEFELNVEFSDVGAPDARFELIRDTTMFNAALVAAGRFGIIYSVVLQARPQYLLHEKRRLHVWNDIKDKIKDHDSDLYNEPGANNHFLQLAVCLTPHAFFKENLVGITKRWSLPVTGPDPPGRRERVGAKVTDFDPRIGGPVFASAGNSHCYTPNPDDPNIPSTASWLDLACSDGNFLRGVVQGVIEDLETYVHTHGSQIGPAIAAVAAAGGGGLLTMLPGIVAILAVLHWILDHLDGDNRFGEAMNTIMTHLLDPPLSNPVTDPVTKAAGLFAWQLICWYGFKDQQGDRDFDAISYAVMDTHDYLDQSCTANVDSVEVFFDSADDRLIGYIDALLNFEQQLEYHGKATVGYASIRFTQPSRALLGMQKHPITAAVEVSCLKDVHGGEELVSFATTLARDPNFDALLHWGQRNDYTLDEVERRYGDRLNTAGGDLAAWRAALSRLTDNGRRDGFSSEFTRRTGLEVVTPKVSSVSSDITEAALNQIVTISWDAVNNPAGTTLNLAVTAANGTQLQLFGNLPLRGSQSYQITQHGVHHFTVQTSYTFGVETRNGTMTLDMHVV